MNKSTASYKMSKPLKMMLASRASKLNAHQLGEWKRAMIDAEIEANKKPKLGKEDRE
jgi:hypothetical protein